MTDPDEVHAQQRQWLDWRFTEAEQFRATVVRQAILLGLNASESGFGSGRMTWSFETDGRRYSGYATQYHAALEYMRLRKVPMNLIGKINYG